MKIGEILGEISKEGETTAKVAKRIDGISEKPLRKALQDAGYVFSNKEPKGWHYHGEGAEPLEDSIFVYAKPSTTKSKSKGTINNASKDAIKVNVTKDSGNEIKEENTMKAEIQALITGKQSDKPNKTYKGIYFDNDIANFLDNVQHGNKSELVNKIMRAYLIENDLM